MNNDPTSGRHFQVGETVYHVRNEADDQIVVEKGTVQRYPDNILESDTLFIRKWPNPTEAPSGIRINRSVAIDTIFASAEVLDAANTMSDEIQSNADEALRANADGLAVALAAIAITREFERALQDPV